jgi:hypothetical protein
VEVPPTRPKTDGRLGAYHIEPALKDLARDFERLHHQTFSVDRASSLAQQAALDEVFNGVLGVRARAGGGPCG